MCHGNRHLLTARLSDTYNHSHFMQMKALQNLGTPE
jgi:hypothetical protein